MYFKNADYKKPEWQQFTTCEHNTCSIPDHMVIAGPRDNPRVTITYRYKTLDERTKAEIIEIIKSMNSKGKFVSKEWVCKALNFGIRKGDDHFVALKRAGKIIEFQARRNNRSRGTYYRMAGNSWKRIVQRQHALMRRTLNGQDQEFLKNSPKGSLLQKNVSKPISSPADGTGENENKPSSNKSPEDNSPPKDIFEMEKEYDRALTQEEKDRFYMAGFKEIGRQSRRSNSARRHTDGRPGDGTENTQYSAAGCFDRLTTFTAECEMVRKLESACYTGAPGLVPCIARSVARRIDSGLINPESVEQVIEIIKKENWSISFREVILTFRQILTNGTEKLQKETLWSYNEQINKLVEGDKNNITLLNKIVEARNDLVPVITKPEQSTSKLAARLSVNFGLSTAPTFAKLFITREYGVDNDTIKSLTDEYKDSLYEEMVSDSYVDMFVREGLKLDYIDWDDFDKYKLSYTGKLKLLLNVNKLSNSMLDNYYAELLNKQTQKYGIRNPELAWAFHGNDSQGSAHPGGDTESAPWAVSY